MKIGFSGAHRTGKTTLCDLVAREIGYKFKPTSVSSVFKKETYQELADMTGHEGFVRGVGKQWEVINHLKNVYKKTRGDTILDRTLIDSFAYTDYVLGLRLMEFPCQQEHINTFNELRDACTNAFDLQDFTFIVQPGIPFVYEKKSADERSQDIINTLVIMAAESYLKPNQYFIIPREVVSLEERLRVVKDVLKVKKVI